jgi:hypothetical protein
VTRANRLGSLLRVYCDLQLTAALQENRIIQRPPTLASQNEVAPHEDLVGSPKGSIVSDVSTILCARRTRTLLSRASHLRGKSPQM